MYVFSGFFSPNFKVVRNVRRPLIIYKNDPKKCNLKATYFIPTRKKIMSKFTR